MTLSKIIKSENCLVVLHHINQYLSLGLKNLLTIESDLHNYSTWNSVNYKPALPQVKTTNCGLHSIRYRTVKHWNSVQNNLKLNFANNLVSSKTFVTAFEKNFHLDNPTIVWYFQRCSISSFGISPTKIMKVLKDYFQLFTTTFRQII